MATNSIPGFSRSDEYESQLYGFSSHDLFLHLKELMLHEIKSSTELVKKPLLELQKCEEDKAATEKAFDEFIAKSGEMSNVALENLRENISSTFSIPSYVLLPTDSVHRNSYSEEDELREKEKLTKLKSRYRRAEFLKHTLQEELIMANQLEGAMEIGKKVMTEVEELKVKTMTYDRDSKNFHKVVQDLLGLEVKEASLKLSDNPCWSECADTKDIPIFNQYLN